MLRRLAHPDPADARVRRRSASLVTPVRSLLQPMVSGLGDLEPVAAAGRPGRRPGRGHRARLVDIGYARIDLVEHRGEIAVRGGILDVFPPTEEHPLRVEFWGDTVEEIRYFRVADQRSLHARRDGLWAPPCRELLLTPAVRERARRLAEEHPGLSDILGKLADGITVEGMEAFAPVLADRMELLLDHVPPGGLVLACDPERIRARADRPGPDQPGVPRGVLGERRRRRPGPDRPRRGRVPADDRGPGGRPAARHRLVDGHPVRQ